MIRARGVPVIQHRLRTFCRFSTVDNLEKDPLARVAPLSTPIGPTLMTVLQSDLLRGTLDLLILKTLTLEPMHGWGIAQRIKDLSGDVFDVNQGSLYPALLRLKRRGWLTATWRTTENNRRARYYSLTREGRRQLGEEERRWQHASAAVNRLLSTA
jgi:PadR family transcriptional regulator PadR